MRSGHAGMVEHVQIEVPRQRPQYYRAANAVAPRVESWDVDPETDLGRLHREAAAADPALRRQADRCHPFAAAVVHPVTA